MGEELQRQLQHLSAIRSRLRNPPNAVVDRGINLKRRNDEPPPAKKQIDIPPDPTVPQEIGLTNPNPGVEWWSGRVTPAAVLHAVTKYYFGKGYVQQIPLVSGTARTHRYVKPRQMYVYMCFRLISGATCQTIGRIIHKDHTTVLHARNRVQEKINAGDEKLAWDVQAISDMVYGRNQPETTLPTVSEPAMEAPQVVERDEGPRDVPQPHLYIVAQSSGPVPDAATAEAIPEIYLRALQSEPTPVSTGCEVA